MSDHHWKPIEDLPESYDDLQSKDLSQLKLLWNDQYKELEKKEAVRVFNERLIREWSIETGVIENLYSIDAGITTILIEEGIDASLIPHGTTDKPGDEVVEILKDHERVIEGLFGYVKEERQLDNSFIKSLHQQLTAHQEDVEARDSLGKKTRVRLLRGEWKKLPNNPTLSDHSIHQYCPPEHVASEMDRLIKFHNEHEKNNVAIEVSAAWLHHRFTQIHPFHDGNGRVARTLASIIFIKEHWFPLVIHRTERKSYIDALEKADQGDLKSLVDIFAKGQKTRLLSVLSLSDSILKREIISYKALLSAIREEIKKKDKEQYELRAAELKAVIEFSDLLENYTKRKLEVVTENIISTFRGTSRKITSAAERNTDKNDYYYHRQIISVAHKLHYFADTRTYRAWVNLKIFDEEGKADFIFSFHSLGTNIYGIIAVSAFLEFKGNDPDDVNRANEPVNITRELFQFTYNEKYKDIERRYDDWFEEVLIAGLAEWKKAL